MCENFGVSVRGELVAPLYQMSLERGGVLDDAVVYYCDVALAVDVRMGIAFIGRAVRRPAGMGNPEISFERRGRERSFETRDLSRCLAGFYPVTVENRDARGIISAVFESLESVEKKRCRSPVADVSDYSTHITALV
jgi:hypothetical protein